MSYNNIFINLLTAHKKATKNLKTNGSINYYRNEKEHAKIQRDIFKFLKTELTKLPVSPNKKGNIKKNIIKNLELSINKRVADLTKLHNILNRRQKKLVQSFPPAPRHVPRSVVREQVSSPAPRSSPIRKKTLFESLMSRKKKSPKKNNSSTRTQKPSLTKRLKKLFT